VVTLASPPLALAPSTAARIAAEQRAFRRALARAVPDARIRWRYRLVSNGLAVTLPASSVAALRDLPGVAEVLPEVRYEPQLASTPGQIGAPALWGQGLETAGEGVKIGIIDTGVDPAHPFFDPAGYTAPPGFPKGQLRFTSAKVIVARVFPPSGARSPSARLAFDPASGRHGTHVAGIAAGNAGTPAGGGEVVSGVAPRAYIGNYKALVETDSGLSPNGNSPELVAAIEAAVRDGMDVLNLSLGEPEIEPSRDLVARALDAAAAAGVVPVVAAGNDFNDVGAGSVSSPASSARAIAVAAVEAGGAPTRFDHADFSSAGPTALSLRLKPDVAAPGVGVLSSVPGGWSSLSGTSMAAPHVAGAAALLRQRHPSWTVAQIRSALVQTGTDALAGRGAVAGPQLQGGGVVSLAEADRPLLFAEPSSLSFGLLRRGATATASVRLEDAGGGAGTWRVAVAPMPRTAAGASVSVPAAVEVPGTLPVEVTVPAGAAEGDVSGYLELRLGEAVRRIPFWGRVTVPALPRQRVLVLTRPGTYRATSAGRSALVSRYRYPEDPRGLGVTTLLRGPELVYRFRLDRAVANLGVVVTGQAAGTRVEPRVVAGLDENRLTGYAALPVVHNPYLETFRERVPVAGALSPRPGEYGLVFDSATRKAAGSFTFRFWVHDVVPPTLRLRSRTVARGSPILVSTADRGSGVYPGGIEATVDGRAVRASFRGGLVAVSTAGLAPGRHRLVLRVPDYQETRNTENVARILPNTATLAATVTVRG